jgi:alpha,alpha-trehalose phosphorylase
MRDHGDMLTFAPRLPPALTKLSFRLVYRGRCLQVTVERESSCYELVGGDPVSLAHHGEAFRLEQASPQVRRNPAPPELEPVGPPTGCPAKGSTSVHDVDTTGHE